MTRIVLVKQNILYDHTYQHVIFVVKIIEWQARPIVMRWRVINDMYKVSKLAGWTCLEYMYTESDDVGVISLYVW